ncbi:DUF1294 domain-containing protein [Rhizobiaceae bacterium BDR2-2]|uniref:DUF1294 domain-containing protein n=1 Tax=Ectorhizobium quercum TaxID=2965071 RepID=A0AAE3N5F6_9HYPH|nr:DUF1294 domain-containing protein [Ectorhizobium quercum]MCX8998882.1 DUF1294 domain-containing protein [Ectorhizobium quercum]
MSAPLVPLLLITLNLAAFVMFRHDKRAAECGKWRISESTLLWVAFLGGSSGAVLGQQVFRHKTRKEPFCSVLLAIAASHIALALLWAAALELGARGLDALAFLLH